MISFDNHAEAEIMQADAVALSKIVHGGEHLQTLVGVKKLAIMKEKSKKWTDAEILYKEAWYYYYTPFFSTFKYSILNLSRMISLT